MSSAADGPKTATPPADTARGATADLADVFIPEPVDQVAERKVQIMEPIFQLSCVVSVKAYLYCSHTPAGAAALSASKQ